MDKLKSCNNSQDNLDCHDTQGSLKTKEKEWFTTDEAAEYLALSHPQALLNMASQGKVKYYKLGNRNRYQINDLKELLLANPRGGSYGL